VGTGSGCVAVALARGRGDARVVATDVSPAALAVAARNAGRHGVACRIQLLECPFLEGVPGGAPFDLLLSNPPYVDPAEEPVLPPELAHEPREALFHPSGDSGFFLRRLAETAARRLAPGAAVLVEIGEAQAPLAPRICEEAGLSGAAVLPDLAGRPRLLEARAPLKRAPAAPRRSGGSPRGRPRGSR
jgi:release factor glutamine methyltransferase